MQDDKNRRDRRQTIGDKQKGIFNTEKKIKVSYQWLI